jgi:hypothetical protein
MANSCADGEAVRADPRFDAEDEAIRIETGILFKTPQSRNASIDIHRFTSSLTGPTMNFMP